MESINLQANRRTATGKQVAKLRNQDQVPAVLYGHGVKSENLTVSGNQLMRVYKQAGSSSLIDLKVDEGNATKVLIHGLQRHPTRQDIIHVDFYQVKMTEKLQAEIELNFIGESPAVKEQGGIFVRTIDKVKVECLPGDLVPSIDVDMTALKSFEDRIHVSDIVPPKGIVILDNPEEVVASVSAPRSEAELEALTEKVETNVEGIATEAETKKKADEEAAKAEEEVAA